MSTVKKVIATITAVIGKVSTDLPTGCRLFVFLCEFTGGKIVMTAENHYLMK